MTSCPSVGVSGRIRRRRRKMSDISEMNIRAWDSTGLQGVG